MNQDQRLEAARAALAAMDMTETDIADRTVRAIVAIVESQQAFLPSLPAPGAAPDIGPLFVDLLQTASVEPPEAQKIAAATSALKAVTPALPSGETSSNRIRALVAAIWSQLALFSVMEYGPLLADLVYSADPELQREITELNKKAAEIFAQARGGIMDPELQKASAALNRQAADLAARIRRVSA